MSFKEQLARDLANMKLSTISKQRRLCYTQEPNLSISKASLALHKHIQVNHAQYLFSSIIKTFCEVPSENSWRN